MGHGLDSHIELWHFLAIFTCFFTVYHQSGKLNQALGVRKAYYTYYYVRKGSILLAGTGVRKVSLVACGLSPIKIHFSIYLKSLIRRINEV